MFLARNRRTPHATAESTRAVVRLPPTLTTRSGGGRMACAQLRVAAQFCARFASREGAPEVLGGVLALLTKAAAPRPPSARSFVRRTTSTYGFWALRRSYLRAVHSASHSSVSCASTVCTTEACVAHQGRPLPREQCRRRRQTIRRRRASRFTRRRTCRQVCFCEPPVRHCLCFSRPSRVSLQASWGRLVSRRGRMERCRRRGLGPVLYRRAFRRPRRRRTRPSTSARYRRWWTTT